MLNLPQKLRRWWWLLLFVPVVSLAQNETSLYALPGLTARVTASGSMSFAREGRLLIIANMLNNTVSVVEPGQSAVRAEIPVGQDPRMVAVTPDDRRAVVVNRGDNTLSVIDLDSLTVVASYPTGVLPYGVITLDNDRVFVALQGADEIIRMDINTGLIDAHIYAGDSPAGLALWGDFLYVSHLWNGDFSLIYVPQLRMIDNVTAGEDVGLVQSITIDPQRGLAYLPATRFNASNHALTFDTTQFPVVNVFDLQDMSLIPRSQITLDTADRPVNLPFATVLDSQRRWLYVASAGSNDVSIIDLTSGLSVANIPTGFNPREVLLSRDNGTLYIHNMIEGSVMLIDTRNLRVLDEIPVSLLTIPSDVYLGAQLFHTSNDDRLSKDRWLSCAGCHFDGQSDGRVWSGYEGGPRNSQPLYDLAEKTVFNWTGSWNELADVELKIRTLQRGTGLIPGATNPPDGDPHSGLSPDLDTLAAYLLTLKGPIAPPAANPDQIDRGAEIFQSLDCASCHSGDSTSDSQLHDMGTGGSFITPRLKWLWMSAPYFHDGSAPALMDVFIMPGAHQLVQTTAFEDIEALVAYLNTLPAQ